MGEVIEFPQDKWPESPERDAFIAGFKACWLETQRDLELWPDVGEPLAIDAWARMIGVPAR